jgi:hypothetical protein
MPVNADIMNLFLGVKPVDGNTPSGSTALGEGSVDGSAFADILGMISNPTPSTMQTEVTTAPTPESEIVRANRARVDAWPGRRIFRLRSTVYEFYCSRCSQPVVD